MLKAILKVFFVFLDPGARTMLPPVAAPCVNGASSFGLEHLKNNSLALAVSLYCTGDLPLFSISIFYNNNLLLGGSITKSGLHRGPNIRYILS